MKLLLSLFLAGIVLAGCSGKDDEGGTSTATPADKLDRPLPADVSGGSSQGAGTLPGTK